MSRVSINGLCSLLKPYIKHEMAPISVETLVAIVLHYLSDLERLREVAHAI